LLRRPPRLAAPAAAGRARWTLALLLAAVLWLAGHSAAGAHRLLRRLGIAYRRGQGHLHSPDPEYAAKLAAVRRARAEAAASGGQVVLAYLDEFTYYRRPDPAPCHAPAGGPGPYAEQGHGRNRKRRVIGALNALGGQLTYWQGAKAGVDELLAFYRRLVADYPEAAVIYVAQDNWPVHFHPRLLAGLAGSKVRLLRLPTYAPWTNPAEKVWRKLKQEVLYQHSFGDDWAGLTAAVGAWLGRARSDPAGLRRYTGLRRRRKKRKAMHS
jgi:transposase